MEIAVAPDPQVVSELCEEQLRGGAAPAVDYVDPSSVLVAPLLSAVGRTAAPPRSAGPAVGAPPHPGCGATAHPPRSAPRPRPPLAPSRSRAPSGRCPGS